MEKRYIKEEKQTPVNYLCDTIVAGGGTAGIVAAIAAARNGAKTILIDRYEDDAHMKLSELLKDTDVLTLAAPSECGKGTGGQRNS